MFEPRLSWVRADGFDQVDNKMSIFPMGLAPADLERLRWATQHLERPSLAARLMSVVGTPIEIAVKLLPRPIYHRLHVAADAVIAQALEIAVSSLRHNEESDPKHGAYRGLVAGTGAIGGFFGVYGLLLELPISTTLMLRAIAEIARAEGEDLHSTEARLACLEVFALGGPSKSDDAAETGYYGIRLALAIPVTQAVHHLSTYGFSRPGAPVLVELIELIGARFGLVISEKAAAQLVPLLGAAGGAAINLAFMSHFQEMARGHFVVRALERRYGRELVKSSYEAILRGDASPTR
jgi:hypothetical protein